MSNFIDLMGKSFGEWVVLEKDSKKTKEVKERTGNYTTYWKCKCSCGTIQSIPTSNLTRGLSTNCGCKRATPSNFVDLTEKKFNRLTVLKRDLNKITKNKWVVYWECLCDCGNIISVASGHLINGHTKSCGCLQKEKANETHFTNLIGYRFEKLIVLERDIEYQNNNNSKQTYWKCKCDCGNIVTVSGGHLINGHTKSCGCINSYGELLISKMLRESDILFKRNFKFEDCLSPKNKHYRFDFCILNKNKEPQYLIEFDGEQHFFYNNKGWNNQKSLQRNRESDLIKNNYCFINNIPLIRIPYMLIQYMNIKDLILQSSNYVLTPENEKEYYNKYAEIK